MAPRKKPVVNQNPSWLDQILTGMRKSFWLLLLPLMGFGGTLLTAYINDKYVPRDEYVADFKQFVELRERVAKLEIYNQINDRLNSEREKWDKHKPQP